ncbi:MAG TPA: hypothetical protein VND91_12305 [Candidatus Saccharimonadia bacterium]|nr:hypothetical protein [Candidatus Saccharimonadia bacterium]
MFSRVVAALCTGAFLVPAADAAISVNFKVGTQQPLICAAAENVRLTPAAAVQGMRFSFDCMDNGVRRTCQPALASNDPDILPSGPLVKYTPTGGGAAITVVCDDSPSAAPVSIKGTEVVGVAGPDTVSGCHPAHGVTFDATVPVDSCIAGSGAGNAACLRYHCPGDGAPRACFPVSQLSYTALLPDSASALRRVAIVCELKPPMLRDDFDS